ncbi:Heat shock protein DnaJ domain protein [Pararobbsia alpina]|uniref:J domain-containing protein n=1 Tax=Pararobbsia alpina TaxID=621374 RepID=UPI0039A4941E
MRIAVLVVFALLGFWIVGAIFETVQKKRRAPSSRSAGEKENAADTERTREDLIDEACRVLQLKRPFTDDELRTAYRQRMSQYHPDKVASLGPEFRELAEQKSKEINGAFALLGRVSR